MNSVLWIAQGLLALGFASSGTMKLAKPRERLKEQQPWAEDFSDSTVKLIGIAELFGAVGLVVPPLLSIASWLAAAAATGLATVMMLAALTHARRKEPKGIGVSLVLGAIAVFVAWGRFGPHQF